MTWATIIAELLKVFGPLLSDLLKKLFENLFTKVAKGLALTGDARADSVLLLNSAREQLRGKPLRRLIAEKMLNHVEANGLVKLEGQERKEFKALAAVAD